MGQYARCVFILLTPATNQPSSLSKPIWSHLKMWANMKTFLNISVKYPVQIGRGVCSIGVKEMSSEVRERLIVSDNWGNDHSKWQSGKVNNLSEL